MRLRAAAAASLALVTLSCRREPVPAPQSRPIRILMGAEPRTFDPQVPFDDVSASILENLFESLVRFDRSFRLTSGLALRWINPDDRTWRFFLDTEARFPDGSPLRAADVKFSIERIRSLAGSELSGFASHIESAAVVDEHTIDLRTDQPIAILNSLAFLPIMSEKHVREAGARVAELPFGTGPYRMTKWERGKSIVLEANPHHRRPPEIPRAEFVVANEDRALIESLLTQKPDLTLFLRRSLLKEFTQRKPPDLHLISSDGLGVFYVAFNLRPQRPGGRGPNPLRDLRARRALALATDVREVIDRAIDRTGRPISQLVVPQVFGFDPRIQTLPHDPDAARRLLAEAGQPALQLSLLTEAGGQHAIEKLLLEQWSRVGIRTELVELESAEYRQALATGGFDVTLLGFACTSGDTSEILSWALHSPLPAQGLGPGNYGAYANPELDRIAEENLRVFDPRRRLDMLQRALRIAAEDLPAIPLFAADDVYVVRSALRWDPPVNAMVRVAEMSLQTPPAVAER